MSGEPHATPDSPRAAPFQFRLRTLLLVTALLGGACALLARLEPIWAIAAVWAALLGVAHVAGNACGTKINAGKQRPYDAVDAPGSRAPRPLTFAPTTRLGGSSRPGWLMTICAVLGALLGGTLGTALLVFLYIGRLGIASTVFGGVSAAVLGGIMGFLVSSCAGTWIRAWNEAAHPRSGESAASGKHR